MADGSVTWVTGLPSSGKSTLAARLVEALKQRGLPALLLDGDEVRDCLVPKLGYSPQDRAAFYQTLAHLAALLARQTHDVVVAATAPRAEFRDYARSLASRYLEVFVDTPAAECARRDSKGLYAASEAQSVSDLPGVGVEYDRPQAPDVVARGGLDHDALERIAERLLGFRTG